jgi:hypothetical protein
MKKFAIVIIVLIFSLSAVRADEPVQYTSETFARLSYINGNVYIQKATELDYEEGMVNMPITEGDRLGTTEGRAEIFMGRGKYIRLDQDTKMDFLDLPRPGSDLTSIQIWRGNIFFSIMSLKKEKTVEIHTNDVSLYILESGLYRIDVRGDETEIFVFRGLLEAAGETGSVLIGEEQKLEAMGGHFPGRPSRFTAVAVDSFDRWSALRDQEIRKRMARRYLPEEMEDFEYELASYGDWTYVFPYGYVWVPGGTATDWRPYLDGRWIWIPVCGWTWLPYEPWGWATAHYGRWHWSITLGWYWIPTPVWGPGWVHWYHGYDYVAWAPVSYWGHPGVVINNIYYGRYADPYYPRDSRALTVIHKNQLKARNVSKVALSQKSLVNIDRIRLSKTQPGAVPADSSKIRLKTLNDSRPFIKDSSSSRTSTKIAEPDDSRRVEITSTEKTKSSEERNIPKTSSATRSTKTSSTLGKITRVLSSGKSKAASSGSSKSSSSKSTSATKIKSNSGSKSSSKVKKSSAPKSSSSKSSSSKKIKKKK